MIASDLKPITERYVNEARQARSHPAKLIVLTNLLKELFGVELVELLPGIETKIGSKIYGFRGSEDLLFRSVIFEVKVDLKREIDLAKEELKKYFQAMHESRPEEKYVGIATDVINFKAYKPIINGNQVTEVSETGSIDLSTTPAEDAILWLDSFLFHKPKIRPTAEDLKFRFGPGSPTYSLAIDTLRSLWEDVKAEPDVKLKSDLWAKNMGIVYGSSPSEEAFLDQTYLVTLVKLIVYYRLSGDNIVKAEQIGRALTGEYFQSYGILNLIEEDFFAWILHPKIADRALALTCNLAKELLRYDMSQIDEDLFKEIYQEIVKRSERHRIGEYYTPEWLVELTLKEALNIWFERNKDKDTPRILDPACGSGTFLCNAIHMVKDILKKRGKKPDEVLDFILNGVVGIDINPLAVTIARANYLIALGELLRLGRSVILPVYVSDSIRLPEIKTTLSMVQAYEVAVNGYKIQIPCEVAKDRYKLGQILNSLREALNIYRKRKGKDEAKALFNRKASELADQAELEILNITLDTLFNLVDRQLNEIWVYMLNNLYAPIALTESKFDMLTSNPPWIAMRYIENKNYQDWLKQAIFSYQLLSTDQVELFSNMEIATLFLNYCADIYLPAKDGLIAFVMPRSVLTGALHHLRFKMFQKPELKLIKIIDCEDVSPLFNVPSCVLIAKKGEKTAYPVIARRIRGKLERKNIKLSQIYELLRLEDYEYKPPAISLVKRSWYYDKLKTGAWLAPRNMWFIDFIVHPSFGINTRLPFVCSSREALNEVKERWKGIELQGNVESNFIYATLLSKDLIPFSFIKLRPIVVLVEDAQVCYRLLDVSSLRKRGFVGVARWLEECEMLWKERTSEKSRERFPSILNRLDYNSLLTGQNPTRRFVLLYGASGTNIVSCVVDKYNVPNFQINNIKIKPSGFIVDVTTWYYESDNENEVSYLCSVLNSNITNELIKPVQTKGLFGERHIHRRPFMFPIPKFDPNDSVHLRLAELSKICHEKVAEAKVKFAGKSVANLRKQAKEVVKEELKEINELVSKLLNL